tara:strand:- start:275 stop:1498 length:1224 start_codon:yes stop_codon:yes gene_type:complete
MNQIESKPDTAKFPLKDVFPNYLEDYINEYLEVMEFDVNAQAMTTILHTASLLDNRITCNYKGKVQKPIIWTCIVQETGTAKSAILEHHTDFLLKKDMENLEPDSTYICDEATYEALLKYSQNNRKGILYCVDELEVLIKGMDNYSQGNKARLMSLWNKKMVKLLRKGEAPIPIEHHKTNILAYTQPKKLASQISSEDFYSGFSNRFVYVEQYDKSFRFENDNTFDPKYTNILNSRFQKIWDIPPMEFVFSKEAASAFKDWYNGQGRKYLDYKLVRDYLPKLSTYAIRLAPIIHVMEFADLKRDDPNREISKATIQRVTLLLEFFIEQYKRMLENRYNNYEQSVLDEQNPEFKKCYRALSEERHYKYGELINHFKSVYSKGSMNSRIKNKALFRPSGNVYFKVVPNE